MKLASRRGLTSVLLVSLVAVVGCQDSSSTAPPDQPDRQLIVRGRAERGLAVRLGVQVGSAASGPVDPARDAIVSVAITPSGAATVSGDTAVLLTAGTISVSATLADHTVLTTTLAVASPPTVVFEGLGATTGRDIYKAALDGGDLARLTQNGADDVEPSVAAGLVIFASYRDGNAELYSVRLDGTSEQRLTRTSANETLPKLSPDGRVIAYSNDASGVTKIWIASRDMTGAAALSASSFSSPAGIETSPAWNATSDRLMFVATAGPSGRASLFTAPPTKGAVPTIVAGSGSTGPEFEPAWNDDGQRVAYALPVNGVTQIFVRDLRTSATTQLTSGTTNCGQPAWLPDGRLIFVRFLTYTSQQLAWLDPAEPGVEHGISINGLSTQYPSAVRQ